MTKRSYFRWALLFTLFASSDATADPPAFVPVKDDGEVLLFDAGTNDLTGVRN